MKSINQEWGSDIRYSNNINQASRGIMVAFERKFNKASIGKTTSFDHGNLLLQEIAFGEKKILYISVYAPNEDSPDFFDSIRRAIDKFIEEIPCDFLIISGDFNLTLDPRKDTKGYRNENNPKATEKLSLLMEEFDLHDVWREQNPESERFTYRQKNNATLIEEGLPPYKQSRLDFFLISGNLLPFVTSCMINYGHRSDHNSISLTIDMLNFKIGKGLWKFNSALVKN